MTAKISKCGRYREWLIREWDANLSKVNFIMLNPSTADADKDDPTINKCMRFAKKWGYGGIIVTNIFDFRATDPEEMLKSKQPSSENNIFNCLSIARQTELVVCAWGNKGLYKKRGLTMLKALKNYGVEPMGLKVNETGMPAHPLYLSEKLELFPL